MGVGPVFLITLVAGGLLGAVNGLLVWKLRLPPIVVTLGTMSIYRGAIYLLSKGAWVNENEMSRGLAETMALACMSTPGWRSPSPRCS